MTRTVVESKTKTAIIGFDEPFCVIGERINPTGRKILNAELEAGDYSRVEADAIAQTAAGATIWISTPVPYFPTKWPKIHAMRTIILSNQP